jgi:3-methylfumaryl-CoA hydratase
MTWTPHTRTTHKVVERWPVTALAALFDDGADPGDGDLLPPLWHWVALARWPSSSMTDVDGHPRRGDFLPPVALPRRMFAGGEVELRGPIRVGSVVRQESSVVSVEEKRGRSGPLVVVVTATELYDEDDRLVLIERQDLVYREAATTGAGQARPVPATPVGRPLSVAGTPDGDAWDFSTDPTLLLRFSAASSNAHRIHYDWPYATGVEGYLGLVVQGPLLTLAVIETVRLAVPGARISRLRHRNLSPLFCGEPARIRSTAGPDDTLVLELAHADAAPDAPPCVRVDVELDRPPLATSP